MSLVLLFRPAAEDEPVGGGLINLRVAGSMAEKPTRVRQSGSFDQHPVKVRLGGTFS